MAALLPIKRALLRYERVYMADPERVEQSVAQHDAIIAALERGEHAEAAQLLRENLRSGLPDLSDAVEHVHAAGGGRCRRHESSVTSPATMKAPAQN